jgi:hypothetical protein
MHGAGSALAESTAEAGPVQAEVVAYVTSAVQLAKKVNYASCTARIARCRLRACALQNKQHREERKMMSSKNSGDEKLLTKGEVARLCRVDVRTVDRWLTAGKVCYQRTPSGRVLFRRHDVLNVVAGAQISTVTLRR